MIKIRNLMAIAILGAFAIVGCSSPGGGGGGGGTGPTAVNLGSAGNFVIIAQSAITDVPTTAITGDMALSPAALTFVSGFTAPGAVLDSSNDWAVAVPEVVGKIYANGPAPMNAGAIATAAAAVADMGTAYTDAATRTPAVGDKLNVGAGTVNGITLTPGLYTWGSDLLITGDLTLAGGANDTWIMQISGQLVLSNGKSIILSGGAQAKNIVWQVSGSGALLGTTSKLQGIVLSKTLITVNTGGTVVGRLMAQTAVNVKASTTVTQP